MLREIAIVSTIEIECPKADALAAVWNIQNIELTEVKADAVEVTKESERKGTYAVHGHFAGLPWRNEFAYELSDAGFHSVEAHPPASGTRISGGFIVAATGTNGCSVIHYEQYKLPLLVLPLKPAIAAYLRWSMRKEMRDLRTLVLQGAATLSRVSAAS